MTEHTLREERRRWIISYRILGRDGEDAKGEERGKNDWTEMYSLTNL